MSTRPWPTEALRIVILDHLDPDVDAVTEHGPKGAEISEALTGLYRRARDTHRTLVDLARAGVWEGNGKRSNRRRRLDLDGRRAPRGGGLSIDWTWLAQRWHSDPDQARRRAGKALAALRIELDRNRQEAAA
jgi:hypothetical protein